MSSELFSFIVAISVAIIAGVLLIDALSNGVNL